MAQTDLARFIDRYTVEFVRHYPHPVERVWRAVTEPGELARWFIAPSVWELKSAGAYRFEDGFKGVIEAVEPPRFIRFNFADPSEAGSYFQFELSPEADGTRLRYLQYAAPGTARPWQPPHAWDTPWGGGNLGGWHSGFEELADLLDGVPCGSRRPPTAFSAIAGNWAEGLSKVDLTAEQKAQIVRELRERERWFELCDVYRAHIDATLPPAKKGDPAMTLGWLETSFPVADVDRTSAFYETFGFAVVDTADEGRAKTLEAGDTRIALYQGILDPAQPQLIFWNGDVEAYADKLVAAGADILHGGKFAADKLPSGLIVRPNGDASIMVRDPDGQAIYLIRMAEVTRKRANGRSAPNRGRCNVALPVKDIAKTVAFYELLGFTRQAAPEDERVAPMVNGESRITLYQGHLDPDELQLNFWQGDIEAMAELVREKGLGFFREPAADDEGRAFMLKDPDGRPLFFINMRKYRQAPN